MDSVMAVGKALQSPPFPLLPPPPPEGVGNLTSGNATAPLEEQLQLCAELPSHLDLEYAFNPAELFLNETGEITVRKVDS